MAAAANGSDYDLGRRNALIDRYFAYALTPDEARELKRYISRDVDVLRLRGGSGEDLLKLQLFLVALGGLVHLMAKS